MVAVEHMVVAVVDTTVDTAGVGDTAVVVDLKANFPAADLHHS